MSINLVNVGFGKFGGFKTRGCHHIPPARRHIKRLRDEARDEKRLIDATQGRRTRSILITDSNHVILSAVQPETIAQRFSPEGNIPLQELEESS